MNWHLPFQVNRLALFSTLVVLVIIGLSRTNLLIAPVWFLRSVTVTLYEWALLLGAFALLVGSFNIAIVHLRRIQDGHADWILSLVLLVVLTTVVAVGLLDRSGTAGPLLEWVYDHLIFPVQSTLFALLIFFLAAAAYRYLRIERPGGRWLLAGVLSMFLIQIPLSQSILAESVRDIFFWLIEWPVMAAFRGALLGMALALLIVAIRSLLGQQ